MPRYNTSLATGQITGSATISSPFQGAFTQLTGTAPYTVTLPNPGLFPGSNQTFYNSTSGTITLSTPGGNFTGTGGTGTASLTIFAGNVASVTSDGTNYIVISEDGSPLIATTGLFSSDVTMNGASANISLTPGGTVTINPSVTGAFNNINIGASTRGSGAFTSLAANGQATFTANIASSSSTTGSLTITGGLGVSGNINSGGTVAAVSLNGPLTGTIQTASQPNITSLGTLTSATVSGQLTVSGNYFSNYYYEKVFDIAYFDNGVANRAVDLRLGNVQINGWIEIEVTGSYSFQNTTGMLRKIISYGANQNNSFWYGPTSTIAAADGPILDNIYIGDLEWDAVNTTYRITIYHTTSTGNSYVVRFKAFGAAASNISVTATAQYTRTAPSPNRHYPSFNQNLGLGTANPAYRLDVSGEIRTASSSTAGRIYFGTDVTDIGLLRDNTYDLVLQQNSASGNGLYLSGAGNVYVGIDSNNNETDRKFIVGNNAIKPSNELFSVDESAVLRTSSGSPVSYADSTSFVVLNDPAESAIVSSDGNYKVMKTFYASKSGPLRIRFEAYIQSGTYYFAYRIRKNNSTDIATGYFSTNLDGATASVHAYRPFTLSTSSVVPGDTITVEMVSSTGGGTPVTGNGQTLYLKNLRVSSSTPDETFSTAIGRAFVPLTVPRTWTGTFSSQTSGSFNVVSQFGLPSGVKALSVVGYYHVTGYGQGASGQGDHALSQFGPRAQGGGTPWSFNTSTDTEWGSFTLEHDGDASGSPHNYGAWNGVGLINVGSSDTVYYTLGRGYSGGTHYNSIWVWGYWI